MKQNNGGIPIFSVIKVSAIPENFHSWNKMQHTRTC